MSSRFGSKGQALAVCVCLLVVGAAGGAGAAGALNSKERKQVQKLAAKVVAKQAGSLTVKKAAEADHATKADQATTASSATNAAAVGGVTITPVSIALKEGDPVVYPIDIQGTRVELTCLAGGLQVGSRRGLSPAPPITGTVATGLGSGAFFRVGFGAGGSEGVQPNESLTASVREASGRVTRLTLDAYYLLDAFGGPEDCFATGTVQRFGG